MTGADILIERFKKQALPVCGVWVWVYEDCESCEADGLAVRTPCLKLYHRYCMCCRPKMSFNDNVSGYDVMSLLRMMLISIHMEVCKVE